jgi:hypothetical protein
MLVSGNEVSEQRLVAGADYTVLLVYVGERGLGLVLAWSGRAWPARSKMRAWQYTARGFERASRRHPVLGQATRPPVTRHSIATRGGHSGVAELAVVAGPVVAPC